MLINRLVLTSDEKSLYVSKNRKLSAPDREAAKAAYDRMSIAEKARKDFADWKALESARKANEFEYYGHGITEYRLIELINSVRATTFKGEPKDFPFSRGPGDPFVYSGPALIDPDDEQALIASLTQ